MYNLHVRMDNTHMYVHTCTCARATCPAVMWMTRVYYMYMCIRMGITQTCVYMVHMYILPCGDGGSHVQYVRMDNAHMYTICMCALACGDGGWMTHVYYMYSTCTVLGRY